MHTRTIAMIGIVLTFSLLAGKYEAAGAQESRPAQMEQESIGQTPPRLSFIEGEVSFWRPGAEEWTRAQINTPLAPGDQLYTGTPGNLELQVGARAFVRASENTFLNLENQEPDFLQFRVTSGVAAFDLRTVDPGRTVEVDTPHASFIIEHEGYYRVNVNEDSTSFITRRSGEATARLIDGEAIYIKPGEHVVVEGTENPRITAVVAPGLDRWDKWNYARTDRVLEAVSSRYVSKDMYGVADLDKAGTWRVVPSYGAVWVPSRVPPGWAPYSNGSWVRDPYYGWTWVDAAPWGWAPYHYGRWVYVSNRWSWAPGPRVVRPHYSPALVAFLGVHGGSVGINIPSGPLTAWVALGWGEPVVPWWGPSHFRRRPYWGGWHGPRIVNKTVVQHTTVVHVHNINVYHNTSVRNSIVAVHAKHFGRGHIKRERLSHVHARNLRPTHSLPRINARPENYVPQIHHGNRPPDTIRRRSVVSTRPSRTDRDLINRAERPSGSTGRPAPAARIISEPRHRAPVSGEHRPSLERSMVDRSLSNRPATPAPRDKGVARHSPSRNITEGVRPNRLERSDRQVQQDHQVQKTRQHHQDRQNLKARQTQQAPQVRQDRQEQLQQRQTPIPPKTSGSVRQHQSTRQQAPPINHRREAYTVNKGNEPASRKQHVVTRGSKATGEMSGMPANRSRPDRDTVSPLQPRVQREAQRSSPGREAGINRQVRSHPMQTNTVRVEPGQRTAEDVRRNR